MRTDPLTAQTRNPLHRHALLAPVRMLAATVPRSVWHPIARASGWITPSLFAGARKAVRENVRRILGPSTGSGPRFDPDRRAEAGLAQGERSMERRTFGNFAVFLGDSFCLSRVTPGTSDIFFSSVEGAEHLRSALAPGKGAILLTPHLGLWELGGHALALAGFPLTVLSLRVDDDAMNRLREEARRRNGIETLYVSTGDGPLGYLAGMRDALSRGRVLCMLADRVTSERPVTVRLAGHRALFPPGGPLLSLLTGAPLLAAFVVLDRGTRYRAWLTPPFVPPAEVTSRDEATADLCQQVADSFAHSIAAHPDQWYNFFPPWQPDSPSAPS